MQSTLKTALMTAALCALAGLANSASAASCRSSSGECTTPPVNVGTDRRVIFRCTVNAPSGPEAGDCRIVDVATGKVFLNVSFWGDSGSRVISGPRQACTAVLSVQSSIPLPCLAGSIDHASRVWPLVTMPLYTTPAQNPLPVKA